ncbi:hypothetical protein [Nonomuraea sp. NEAU-A123]|uniref:hypothetical protein n=1 Tax=Nonomuraea sp. NEAU-A123 TaxID=2839649 RepID=UPI001BE46E93|nr:hypothetical protein [Nonomuraea sp. NEAU-A123]MBT2229788.1 hypothetical protein [Nonomuraea sp. NEAU-A123]
MACTHTTASADDLLGQPISEEKAVAQNAALDRVLKHLTAAGVHAELIKRLVVECEINPDPSAATFWHPPELKIYADEGWRVATISIGPRSGSYMVELAQWGEDNEPRPDKIEVISGSRPEWVATLITGSWEGAS